MKRLSRMWEEKLPGRLQKRFEPHRAGAVVWGIRDNLHYRKHPDMLRWTVRWYESDDLWRNFRSRKTAEAFLKRTTMRAFQVREVELKLNQGAA